MEEDSPVEVARYLLKNKDVLDKSQIGDYLGREAEYQNGFALRVLHAYVNSLDFSGLDFDDAIRYYLSGFRLPGEAQKVRMSGALTRSVTMLNHPFSLSICSNCDRTD
jgi:brefeldin A-inhibited guanine nucleotide-exchange protein